MKKLFEFGNRYAKESDWTDFALTKLCLCAMGMLIGLHIPEKQKSAARYVSLAAFASSYTLLMSRMLKLLKKVITKK